jgi:dienelactone hydrolase
MMAVSVTTDQAFGARSSAVAEAKTRRTRVWRGASLGLERGAPLVVAIIGGISFLEFRLGLGWFVDFVVGFLLLFALYHGLNGLTTLAWKLIRLAVKGVGSLIARGSEDEAQRARALAPYRLLSRVRGETLGAVLAPIAIVFMDKIKFGDFSMISQPAVTESLIPFGVVACVLVGVALAGDVGRKAMIALLAAAVLIVAAPVAWYAWPGDTGYLAQPDAQAVSAMPRFTFENPALPGPHPVKTLSYGSGAGMRAEFNGSASLITPTVDATPAYDGWQGLPGSFYSWIFGRDFKRLPLNGLVWYPEGEGPFPIVLIVHGNHGATDYSDPGYAYLGEHLASRGFITVSVDENFLNGHALWDGKGSEMPVRAWLLLKHLQVWRGWNAEAGNPFYGKVDLDRVALMGHSRGAEAVAHAAMLNNKIDRPLNRVAKDGEFGFGIRGVVAIAPPDGQYKPAGMERRLIDVSYLLLQGGHDQDLASAVGMRQYIRTRFEANADAFKAVAYVYRANHGNFSTVWGSNDHGFSGSTLLNRAGLLKPEEQRTAGKVFMTAFLEAALMDKADYRKVFITPAGAREWLPQDVYVTQYQDASFKAVNTHDRLGKVELADMKQMKVETHGLINPAKPELPLRDAQSQANKALLAQWEAGANPFYSLTLLQGKDALFSLKGDERLVFSLGNAMQDNTPLYVTVELVDAQGEVAAQPVNRFGIVPPPLPAKLEKSNRVSKALGSEFFPKLKTPYEQMLQSFEIPLSAFTAVNPDFDAAQVETIRFRFNDEKGGRMYVDEVGFRG